MGSSPEHSNDVLMIISGNLKTNQTNRNVNVGVLRNGEGSVISPMTVRTTTANQPFMFTVVAYIDDVNKGDYFELHLTSSSNGDIVTVEDINWYTSSR